MVLQSPNPTQDSYGQEVTGWSTVATVWAAVEPINGREYLAAQQLNAETKVRIRLRYGSEIDAISQDWRATYDGKIYDIKEIIRPSEINHEIILMCGEGVNSG